MHIDKEVLDTFQENELKPADYIQVLEHIESCDYCAENLASLEEDYAIQAPRYLKSQIISRTQMLDVQTTVQMKKSSKKVQFLLHSFKTATAVAGALLLLFTAVRLENAGTLTDTNITSEFTGRLSEGSNYAVDFMNEFSNKIISGGMKR